MEKIRVAIVDDSDFVRDGMRVILSVDERFEVAGCAANGQEAIDLVKKCPVDVVLMDIQMPIMDGYEATKAIRDLDNRMLANVPIVAMTANAFGEERKKAFACGMNGYVTKPIDINVLFETLKQIIE